MTAFPIVDIITASALAAGERRSFALRVAPLADGTTLTVPVHMAKGARTGPVLALVAGVHGDEPDGVAALLDLWAELPHRNFAGTLLLVPIANPPAFAAHQRCSPIDGVDLNRAFPGDLAGSVSQRLAAMLYRLIVENADCLFTLHSWYAAGDCIPHVEFQDVDSPVRDKALAAAIGSGFSLVRATAWHPGLLPRAVSAAGIPAIEAEIGGLGIVRTPNVTLYRRHIEKLLGHLNMVASGGEPAAEGRIVTSIDLRAPMGGILHRHVQPGELVVEGQVIAVIASLTGDYAVNVVSLEKGLVLAARQALSTSPGDILFRIALDLD